MKKKTWKVQRRLETFPEFAEKVDQNHVIGSLATKFKEETSNRSAIFEKIHKICGRTVESTSESLCTQKNMIIQEIVAKNKNIFKIRGKP